MKKQWNDLLENCENRDILFSHKWYNSWSKFFTSDEEIFVITATDSENLKAILPLMKINYKKKGLSFKAVKSMTNDFSERFDVIFNKPTASILSKMLKIAFDESKSTIMILEKMPEDSFILRYLKESCQLIKCNYIIRDQYENRQIQIENSFDKYLNKLVSKNFKRSLKKTERKANERGAIKLIQPKSIEELEQMLQKGFKVEAQSWKSRKGTAIAQNEQVKNFYTLLAKECFQSGNLELFLLKSCDDDIAFLFCIGNYGCLRALKIGMNVKFSNIGPGMMITKKALEKLFLEKKYKLWDFCGGPAKWKSDWSFKTENLYKVFIFRNSLMGRVLYKFANNYH